MRDRIRSYLSNGASRRALITAGVCIAGAYMGYVAPGGIEVLHEAFQYAVTLNPFTDPIAQISALYDGARQFAAAALHSVGDWLTGVGVEVGQRLREEIERARAFLGPFLEQARTLFCEAWQTTSEAAATLRDQIRNSAPSLSEVVISGKELLKTAVELVRHAAEAYGLYETAKKIYQRVFARARADLDAQVHPAPGETPAVTARSVNLNLNIGVGGAPVADAALRSREIRISDVTDPTAGISGLGSDRIIWVSDKLRHRLSDDLSTLTGVESGQVSRVSLRRPPTIRLEDVLDPVEDLRHRARFPTINWGESALSETRLDAVRGARGRIGELSGIRLTDQVPVRNDARIVLGEDGFLRAEARAPVPTPHDLTM